MGRLARHYALETRAARDRLRMAHEPYWSSIHPGLFLGYRKGKRGGVWYTRRTEGTHYVKDRIGIADDHRDADNQTVFSFAQAQKKAIEWAGTASRGLSTAFDPNYTVADAVRDYLDWADLHQKAPKRTRQTVNAHILPRLGTIRASELSPHQIERWRQGLVTKPRRHEKTAPDLQDPEILRKRKSSSNRILTVLKAALNFAYRSGNIERNDAWDRVKPFRRTEAPKIRFLSPDECLTLLQACEDPAFHDLVKAALLTGARYGELTAFRCKDFDPSMATLYVADSKSGKPRHIPLNDEGVKHFNRLVVDRDDEATLLLREDGFPWGRNHQQRAMKNACVKAKINPAISFHVLRHTYASLLAQAGMSLQAIANALGHADTRTTERHYAHLQPSYVHEQIRQHLPSFHNTHRSEQNSKAQNRYVT